ncbi:unnamed protein product [Amoebophrya sp. A25]|nr:unnamed protein product [Amoebophrya sp. A25]|eukprot:GSA25T00003400001.1
MHAQYVEHIAQNCGSKDDNTYQPGGNATMYRVVHYSPGDPELVHLKKCAQKCTENVVSGPNGCGGFVYERSKVNDPTANLAGVLGACTLRRGPVVMSDSNPCPQLPQVRFYKRMSAVVTVTEDKTL